MCECGCGELRPLGTFPAPGTDLYVLEIYPGCGDCKIGPGVTIHRMTQQEAREFGLSADDALKFHESPREFSVPMLDPAKLGERVKEELGDDEYEEMMMGGNALSAEVIRHAVHDTLGEWRKAAAGIPTEEGAHDGG